MNNALSRIELSFDKLMLAARASDWKGSDPYDGLESPLYQMIPGRSKLLGIALIQLIRRCPVNLRPFLRVPDQINSKGLGLFARACLSQYRSSQNGSCLDEGIALLDHLEHLSAVGYSGPCWGYNFDWQSRTFFVPKNTPNVICTTYIGNAFLDAFETTGDARFLNIAEEAVGFILTNLNRSESDGLCFSYTPVDRSRIYNASLWAAQFLLRVGKLSAKPEHDAVANQAIDYVLSAQLKHGGWYYGADANQAWIDSYHTGYVIEAIHACCKLSGRQELGESASRGLRFFMDQLLPGNGTTKFRHDQMFPIDIHAQAQSIVTLVKAGETEHQADALRVADWTIRNMQSVGGGFYYQKRKRWSNCTIHQRWGNAWMAYALSIFLESVVDEI